MCETVYQIRSHLQELEWRQFEHFVADVWTLDGWTTHVTGEKDQYGEDVRAERHTPFKTEILLQAKAYTGENKVSKKEIDISSLPPRSEFDSMIVVTSNTFTQDARDAADFRGTKLVNGLEFALHIKNVNAELILKRYLRTDAPTGPDVYETLSEADHINITDINQIGSTTAKKLSTVGIEMIGQLAEIAHEEIDTTAEEADLPPTKLCRLVTEASYQKGDASKVATLIDDTEIELIDIEGIGPEYAQRLASADISTVSDLAVADPIRVSESTNLTAQQIETWSRRARYQSS